MSTAGQKTVRHAERAAQLHARYVNVTTKSGLILAQTDFMVVTCTKHISIKFKVTENVACPYSPSEKSITHIRTNNIIKMQSNVILKVKFQRK